MVAGNWRVIDGKITDSDEAQLIHRHSEAAKKLRQLASV
jgi:8-oxoguanine deaminase